MRKSHLLRRSRLLARIIFVVAELGFLVPNPGVAQNKTAPANVGIAVTFADVAKAAGLKFKQDSTTSDQKYPCGQRTKLYHNNHDGTFTDVSDSSGVGKP